MTHRKRLLWACRECGYVCRCSCGQYHVHVKGVTIHLDEWDFCRFVEMLEQARKTDTFADSEESRPGKGQLRIVK